MAYGVLAEIDLRSLVYKCSVSFKFGREMLYLAPPFRPALYDNFYATQYGQNDSRYQPCRGADYYAFQDISRNQNTSCKLELPKLLAGPQYLHSGSRFWRKAVMPSWASSLRRLSTITFCATS